MERAWRFVKVSTSTTQQPRYRIQKCVSKQYLAWTDKDKTMQYDSKRYYVFDESEQVYQYNEWLIVPEKDGKHYQILDAVSGKKNLYVADKSLGKQDLVLVWTGVGNSDWSGSENLKRLWRFEKINQVN